MGLILFLVTKHIPRNQKKQVSTKTIRGITKTVFPHNSESTPTSSMKIIKITIRIMILIVAILIKICLALGDTQTIFFRLKIKTIRKRNLPLQIYKTNLNNDDYLRCNLISKKNKIQIY